MEKAKSQIEALKRENAALQDQLQRAIDQRTKLLDALGDAFLLVEDESIIRVANEQAVKLLGRRDLIDRELEDVILDSRLLELLRDSLSFPEQITRRVLLRLPNFDDARHEKGLGEVALEIDTSPFSRTQHLKRITIRNVTESHITEQVRKDFVANASHELRTPLAIINGYLENLLEDDLINEPKLARRFLKTMRKHSSRIARIVEDMLVISKLESGEAAALKIKPFRLSKCIDDVLERLGHIIEESKTTVKVKLDTKSLKIHGDRFYWTQILFNLVENAIKQNFEAPLRVEIGARHVDDKIEIWVADDGVGISSSHLPFIFKRFYRVETHHSKEIRGTGLGLSIVKRAVEAHQGTIEVTSTPGKETRFSMTIPESIDAGDSEDDSFADED